MSVELVNKAMHKFLTDPCAQVLCVSGRWGTERPTPGIKRSSWPQLAPCPCRNTLMSACLASRSCDRHPPERLRHTIELKPSTFAKLDQQLSATVGVGVEDLKRHAKKLTNVLANHASVPWVSGLAGAARL